MISSYFKYAFRNLVKQRGRTLINLVGLSASLALVIVIFLYVSHELSMNNFHKNRDRIYRMYNSVVEIDGERIYSPYTPAEMAGALKENIPGIEATCRLKATPVFIGPGKELFQEYVAFADSTFFDLFTYEILAGNREGPLDELKSVVLTETVARKIFPDSIATLDELVGRTVKFPEEAPFNLYTVTAIIADPPENTYFKWTAVIPYPNSRIYPRSNDFGGDTYTYVMLDRDNNLQRLERTAQDLVDVFHGEGIRLYIEMGYLSEDHDFTFHFLPYKEAYLESNMSHASYSTRGDKNRLYILSCIAVLILFIACFNYVMISIGTALNRLGDFGLMKVVGAGRWQILLQFVVESFMLALTSMFLGIILAEQMLPIFSNFVETDLSFSIYSQLVNYIFLLSILLFVVLSTSAYIGFYLLRRSQPLRLLRKEMLSLRRNGAARFSIVLQFFIALVLLISGGVIAKQLNYLLNRDVGFHTENTVVVPVDFELQRIRTLKELMLESPHISHVTMSDRNFNSGSSSQGVQNKRGELVSVRFLRTDTDYLETLGLELVAGRNFIRDEPDDSIPNVIVNETLVREFEIEDPAGARFQLNNDGEVVDIIGVVRDFHFDSMHDDIQPLMLHTFQYNNIWYLFVRAQEDRIAEVLTHCEKVWKEVVPEFSWEYEFMEDILERQYTNENKWSQVLVFAAAMSILLSCLGLMGISGILIARRFKEVGIRKANGATIPQIIYLLNMDILKWVLLSYVLACPVAWLAMKRWLRDFAFQTSLSWWIFLLAGLAAVLISIGTITFQIYRVARQNPVHALRYE